MRSRLALVAAATAAFAVAACQGDRDKPAPASTAAASASAAPSTVPAVAVPAEIDPDLLAAFAPLPEVMDSKDNPITPEKIELGRMLYFDTRLSKNHDVSCNTCHLLAEYGVDKKRVSTGHKAQTGTRNSPTVYNAAGHLAQFWDGRSATVEEQARGPVVNPVEMAMPDEASAVAVLKSIPGYVEGFKKAFSDDKDPITIDNFAKAVGAFERKLVTPSRWDAFLKGDRNALTAAEKAGFKKFAEVGCTTCHAGPYLGGAMFQKAGSVRAWPNEKDLGRFEVTKQESDRMFFKVPSLRNIDKTAPYFHDGSTESLEEAVKLMALHQLGKTLADSEVNSITTWLVALTGEIPADYVKPPELPKSGPSTPKPNPN